MLNKLTKARAPGSDTDTDTFFIHSILADRHTRGELRRQLAASLGLPAHVGDNVCLPSELGTCEDGAEDLRSFGRVKRPQADTSR